VYNAAAIKATSGEGMLTISNCSFESLSVTAVSIESQESVSVSSSTFEGISSYETIGVRVSAKTSVALTSLMFKNIRAEDTEVLMISPSDEYLETTLTSLTFSNISSSSYCTGIRLDGAMLHLNWSGLQFEGLQQDNTSILNVVAGSVLSSNSEITGLTAKNFKEISKAAVQISMVSGTLTFSDCSFSASTARYVFKIELFNEAQISLRKVTFSGIKGTGIISLIESADGTMVSTNNCVIADNTARAVSINAARWTDTGSTIQNNSKGGVFANSGYINLTGTKFLSNKNPEDGGAVQLTYKCTFLCSSCTFTANSTSTGGAIRLDQGSVMTVTKSTFTSNSSTAGGSALYLISSNKANVMTECSITANNSQGAGTVTLIESTITISTTSFSKNVVAISGGGLQLNSATLNCTQCTFADQIAPYSSFGQISTNSIATFVSSTFDRGSSNRNGGAFVLADSTGTFDGCSGSSLTAQLQGGFVYMSGQR
jgi:hypothetical protein